MSATGQHAFVNADKFAKFIEGFKAPWFQKAESSASYGQVFQYGQLLMFESYIVHTNVFELTSRYRNVSEWISLLCTE